MTHWGCTWGDGKKPTRFHPGLKGDTPWNQDLNWKTRCFSEAMEFYNSDEAKDYKQKNQILDKVGILSGQAPTIPPWGLGDDNYLGTVVRKVPAPFFL